MKIFRWSALVFAVAAAAATGCSQQGCGATDLNGTSTAKSVVTCGPGTSAQNGVCIPALSAKTK